MQPAIFPLGASSLTLGVNKGAWVEGALRRLRLAPCKGSSFLRQETSIASAGLASNLPHSAPGCRAPLKCKRKQQLLGALWRSTFSQEERCHLCCLWEHCSRYKETRWLRMHKQAGITAGHDPRHTRTRNDSPPAEANNAARATNDNSPTRPLSVGVVELFVGVVVMSKGVAVEMSVGPRLAGLCFLHCQ